MTKIKIKNTYKSLPFKVSLMSVGGHNSSSYSFDMLNLIQWISQCFNHPNVCRFCPWSFMDSLHIKILMILYAWVDFVPYPQRQWPTNLPISWRKSWAFREISCDQTLPEKTVEICDCTWEICRFLEAKIPCKKVINIKNHKRNYSKP